ncbi:hypothetical protein [Halobellus clavatus]|uniref:hypothetical protein n=1 Tax=Halobellus clavatus TaxID=660517 RepID=UPI001587B7E9|nr:hypothetical protein [Halobellus clavatus]
MSQGTAAARSPVGRDALALQIHFALVASPADITHPAVARAPDQSTRRHGRR